MKVLFLLNDGFGIGGTIRTTFNLAGALAARGHDVEVLSTRRRREVPQLALDPRVRLMSLLDEPAGDAPAKVYPAADYRAYNYDLPAEQRYERYLRSSDADVVIATRAGLIAYAATFAPRRMVRIGQEHLTRMQQRPAMRAELPRHIRKLDAFVTVSERDAADYRANLRWLRGTQVLFIPNSVPEPRVQPSDSRSRIVVAAGRLVPLKRYDLLIRAFAKVVAEHPDWQLRIYGGGDENARLRELVLESGLHNHVLLMGSYFPLEAEWAKGAISASAADKEPFGMTLVEAMRCGLPVVSTDAPWGPREILDDGGDGLLTPVGDEAALGDALLRLTADDAGRRAMGEAALRASARYDPDAVAARYEELFEQLKAKKRKSRRPAYGDRAPALGPAPTLTLPIVDCEVTAAGDVLLRPGPAIPAGAALTWRRLGVGEQIIEQSQTGPLLRLGELADGAWELRTASGEAVVAGVRETRSLLTPAPPGAVARQLPYRMVTGGLAVRVWQRPVHAEVASVQVDDAGVHVTGSLHGAVLGPQPALVLASRDRADIELPVEALSPTGFRFTVPELPPGLWHPTLSGGRLGRFLDDVADKKTAYVLPAVTVGAVRMQPVYLWGNEFSVQVTGWDPGCGE